MDEIKKGKKISKNQERQRNLRKVRSEWRENNKENDNRK